MDAAKRIIIVGGVAGGASAATRARRLSEKAVIIMIERGEHVSFANCGLPYHIGGTIPERASLFVQNPQGLARRYGIDVRIRSEVLRIDRRSREVLVRDLASGREYSERFDALVLSPGAAPVRPALPGVDNPKVCVLRSVADMDRIKAMALRGQGRAVVVGGGYVGLEMVEALRKLGMDVSVVELTSQVMGPVDPEIAFFLHKELRSKGVDLRLNCSVTAFEDEGDGLAVTVDNGKKIACQFALMAIGVRPETTLAREAGLAIGQRGGILVDEHMRTSDPDIYAVGDAVEVPDFVSGSQMLYPLAGPANRQARIAADNIMGRDTLYHRTQGTAICKVFGLAVAMTGLSEKALLRQGAACEKIYVHSNSHAAYYPGAETLTIKLLFDPSSGRILGAQVVGADGVDKRIDVLATALRAGMTVFDLENLELAYAPPYGSAKDPVNYAGFVAANVVRGDMRIWHAADAAKAGADRMLLDVRTPGEFRNGTIAGATNIPVEDLRRRIGELPKDRELLVFCQVGLRGYLACRILSQNGLACRNLTGGYRTFLSTAG
ncbi:MAG: CoA-disulfide reductase [Verrucomicrobia bacterium]|nr:CoA-disulfide reductase [Verrucomicrobiota bacterium]